LSGSFKVSLEWLRKFMKAKLGWSFRTTIIDIRKQPPNWEDQRTKMAHRVTYLVKTYNVLASLVINTD
jgi:disulfide oxidoreductase YuzD